MLREWWPIFYYLFGCNAFHEIRFRPRTVIGAIIVINASSWHINIRRLSRNSPAGDIVSQSTIRPPSFLGSLCVSSFLSCFVQIFMNEAVYRANDWCCCCSCKYYWPRQPKSVDRFFSERDRRQLAHDAKLFCQCYPVFSVLRVSCQQNVTIRICIAIASYWACE